MKIAVLMACHNRRDVTLSCLKNLFSCRLPEGAEFEVYLTDDGSSDGTQEAVGVQFPSVKVLRFEQGDLYWNGGMRVAFAAAETHRFDYYLWLNDDTLLFQDALETLLSESKTASKTGSAAIVVGSTCDRSRLRTTHGGLRRFTRLNAELVEPGDSSIECSTMYGNCVLIPAEITNAVGNLDPVFVHSMGDVDYGLRARRAGFRVLVMPGFAGICDRNPIQGSYMDRRLGLSQRFRMLVGPKGLPPRPWLIFLWRHLGLLGLAYWVWTYSKVPLDSIFAWRGRSERAV